VGLCTLKLSVFSNVLDVDKSINFCWWFLQVELFGWNYCHTLDKVYRPPYQFNHGRLAVGSWNSISGSSTVCWLLHTLAGLSTFGHNFDVMEIVLAPRSTSYTTTLWFASWNLDSSIYWLSISPSWLLLIIHGIGNLTKTLLLGSLIGAEQNLSGTLHPLVFIVSEDYLSWMVTGVWTLGHWTFHLVM